jgi:hypothetical protein
MRSQNSLRKYEESGIFREVEENACLTARLPVARHPNVPADRLFGD